MRELLRRLHFWFQRDQFERDLDEEMRHHLALQAEERGSGAAALRQFGNVTLLKEESRAMWTWRVWEEAAQDVRYGLRAMNANRTFTAMAALSLALGIGANTAIYSFMDAILMRSLPVRAPGELVNLGWQSKANPAVIHGQTGSRYREKTGVASPDFPFAAFAALRGNSGPLSALFAYSHAWNINVVAAGHAEVAQGLYVSGGFFQSLGVAPAAGRLIADDDDRPGAPPAAVISHPYWERYFARDPAAIGRIVQINHIAFTIVGVSAPEFWGLEPGAVMAVFLPLHSIPLLGTRPDEEARRRYLDRNFYWMDMVGRLRPGVRMEQAQAALAPQFQRFVASTAVTAKEQTDLPALRLAPGGGGLDSLRRRYSEPLYVLMAMVALILTIACANIANLLLARATARRREMAVRLSLGAGRLRIVRQLLTESLLLATLGGLLGIVVSFWATRSISWLIANGQENFRLPVGLNLPVLGFTLALSLAAGIVFGLAPAIQTTRVDVTPALKESRMSAARGRGRRGFPISLSQALVVAQIGLSLVLVVAATLFVRTLANLQAIDLGFNRDNVLLFSLNARQGGYKDTALTHFYSDLLDSVRRIPGVRKATLSNFPLAAYYYHSTGIRVPGMPAAAPGKQPETALLTVDPAFLETMQIPILLGRDLEERDLHSPGVAVINETLAKKFFPNQNPVGLHVGLGDAKKPPDIEIVGIAKDARYNSLKEKETPPVTYVPFTQDPGELRQVSFEVRTAGNPLALVSAVRQVVQKADRSVPLSNISTQADLIDQTINRERTFAQLCTCFAVLALTIACVGLYGTMAYTVARRTGEIGIRMALGAARRRIVWMVLREVLALAGVGLAIGLGAAWSLAHLVESFLFGMKPHDPMAVALSVAVLATAALVAGYLPAWRAARIDPTAALRHE